jgi:hypothetical protein
VELVQVGDDPPIVRVPPHLRADQLRIEVDVPWSDVRTDEVHAGVAHSRAGRRQILVVEALDMTDDVELVHSEPTIVIY